MKITFTGTFNIDDIQLINEFIEIQQTTDRVTENTMIELDGVVLIRVIVDKYGDIEKIHFRKI